MVNLYGCTIGNGTKIETFLEIQKNVTIVGHCKISSHSFICEAVIIEDIATYNEGLDWASADYVLLLSADDLLASGALARAVRLMDTHEEVGLTHGNCLVDVQKLPTQCQQEEDTDGWVVSSGLDFIRSICATAINPVGTASAIARTSLQKRLSGYRKELPHSGDLEMWLRFAAHGSIGRIHAVQAIYRHHDTKMSKNYYSVVIENYVQVKAAFDFFFDHYGDVVPGSRELRAQAERMLAANAFASAVAQFCYGNMNQCRELLDFSFKLCNDYRFSLTLVHLMRRSHQKAKSVLESFINHFDDHRFGHKERGQA